MAYKLQVATQTNDQTANLDKGKVLFLLPHHNFRDKEYTWLKERFDENGITSEVASTHLSEAQGRFGTLVKPDVLINFVESADYDAYIFVGEEAASEFFNNRDVQRIIERAMSLRKIVAAIGEAVPVLLYSGHFTNRKVTTTEAQKSKVEELGTYFTGRIVEQDGDLITANGPYGTREFAEAIIKALAWSKKPASANGRQYLK